VGENKTQSLAGALVRKESDWWKHCTNDFEGPVFSQHPEIGKAKKQLLRKGAETAMMSGSGSAVFGLFANREARDRAGAAIPGSIAIQFVKAYGAK
jgi:4-diphosphocytidyl-2C-methyl-D-erythritol kinase